MITPALTSVGVTRAFHDALIAPGFHELFEGSEPSIWSTEMPAVNGALSADALARLYGALANGGGGPLLSAATVHDLGRVQVRTADAVLGLRMRWRLGYHHAFGTGRGARRRSATTATADRAAGPTRTSASRSASSRTGSAPSPRRWRTSRSTA